MSGIGGSEFLLLCLIGLLILGPERLPRVARQLGTWIGKARQMARALRRQLEEEIEVEKNLGINPKDFHPDAFLTPRDDDNYSPLHDQGGAEDSEQAVQPGADAGGDDVPEEKTA